MWEAVLMRDGLDHASQRRRGGRSPTPVRLQVDNDNHEVQTYQGVVDLAGKEDTSDVCGPNFDGFLHTCARLPCGNTTVLEHVEICPVGTHIVVVRHAHCWHMLSYRGIEPHGPAVLHLGCQSGGVSCRRTITPHVDVYIWTAATTPHTRCFPYGSNIL